MAVQQDVDCENLGRVIGILATELEDEVPMCSICQLNIVNLSSE